MATTASVSKKRKRDEEKVLLGEPFFIQPHTSSVFESAIKIVPAVVFPRKSVPPNWLAGVPPRLFSAHIPALDTPGNVLITKTEGERQLSAVEKVSDGVFTLCKLSANVKMGEVRRLAQIVKKPAVPPREYVRPEIVAPGKEWWKEMLLEGFDVGMGGRGGGGKGGAGGGGGSVILSMMHPSVKRKAQEIELQTTEVVPDIPPPQPESFEFSEPTPETILDQLLSQYLKTLYITKSSIAYFTKSALSRARVKFQPDPQLAEKGNETTPPSPPPPGIDQLVEYLQGMLLPLDKMDVKYRKTVIQIASEDTLEDGTMLKKGEEEYVLRWVKVNFQDVLVQQSDPRLKRQIDELKIRETELQIILLLEILALTKEKPCESAAPPEDSTKKTKKKSKSFTKKKSKGASATANAPDPNVILDLLLDRLCIWRSIGSGVVVPESERPNTSHSNGDQKGEEDHLRHFCVEIVMAFYSSRLPETCTLIQKKFGVNAPALSGVPGSAKKPSSSSSQQQDSLQRKKRPSMSRSLTMPAGNLSGKRAGSAAAPEFVNVPKLTWKNVDIGAATKKTLQKREIQMPALKPTAQTVEDELKDAIRSLSKPNRGAIGAEVMDAATRRLSAIPVKKPTRKSKQSDGVLVTATPSKKDKFKRLQHTQLLSNHPEGHRTQEDDDDEDHILPAPKFPLKKKGLQTAIFASPVKTKRSYGGARYAANNAASMMNAAAGKNGKIGDVGEGGDEVGIRSDHVPESSPPPMLGTPVKGASGLGVNTTRRNMFTEKLYGRQRELMGDDDDDEDGVPGTSPVGSDMDTRTKSQPTQLDFGGRGKPGLSLERSKSCLFPARLGRGGGLDFDDSPRIVETPQRAKSGIIGGSFLRRNDGDGDGGGSGGGGGIGEGDEDDDGEDGFDANLLLSSAGGGGSGGKTAAGGLLSLDQTPVRVRRPYSQPKSVSTLLDFRNTTVVGESPVKAKRGGGGGGGRGKGVGVLDFMRRASGGGGGGISDENTAVPSSSPILFPQLAPVGTMGRVGGGGGDVGDGPEPERSIYESLGWDDDFPI